MSFKVNDGILVSLDVRCQSFLVYLQLKIWWSIVSGRLHLGHSSSWVMPNFFNRVPLYISPWIDLSNTVFSLVFVILLIFLPRCLSVTSSWSIISLGFNGVCGFKVLLIKLDVVLVNGISLPSTGRALELLLITRISVKFSNNIVWVPLNLFSNLLSTGWLLFWFRISISHLD